MSNSMSRQHFNAVAETLRLQLKFAQDQSERAAIIRVAGALAADFKQFNIHFDRSHFMDAVLADAGTYDVHTDTEKDAYQRLHQATTVNYGSL